MVLQNPMPGHQVSNEIIEYDEAPLDLSVSNRNRCSSPPKFPEYFRTLRLSPDDEGEEDSLSPDPDFRDAPSPDSDEFESQAMNLKVNHKKILIQRYSKSS